MRGCRSQWEGAVWVYTTLAVTLHQTEVVNLMARDRGNTLYTQSISLNTKCMLNKRKRQWKTEREREREWAREN